jgi:hypothetical protein
MKYAAKEIPVGGAEVTEHLVSFSSAGVHSSGSIVDCDTVKNICNTFRKRALEKREALLLLRLSGLCP